VRVTGLGFVGTRTGSRATMTRFMRDVLGLASIEQSGIEADLFELPDGATFAVAPTDEQTGERTVGFMVDDLDGAANELRAAGVEVDDTIGVNDRFRYVHFRAPDGKLYELVEVVDD
jgi:catechol 2,3-dioxygenase-like lactoylglutathione lyase family enzyme